MKSHRFLAAYTFVEVLVSVGVLAVLIAIVGFSTKGWLGRAEGVRCTENMRSLHTSLASYIQDRGHWPQEPPELVTATSPDVFEDWWIAELAPFGATERTWQCATIFKKISSKAKDGRPKVHYTPTMFDEKPFTPYRWSTQPWLIEIGNMHGRGALACFPDGSVRALDDIVPRRK